MSLDAKEKTVSNVTIIVPAYNEAAGIGVVLDAIATLGRTHQEYRFTILIVDNNSSDNTAAIALQKGATVINEQKQGKGNALRAGFTEVCRRNDSDYVIMIDADGTYSAQEIPRLLEPIQNGFADVILGSRLGGKIYGNAMSLSHRLANWLFTFPVRHFYKANVTDICTGFFAWKSNVIQALTPELTSPGFSIETEMVTKMARMGYELYSVPISYKPRKGVSKLSPIKDAFRIIGTLVKNSHWNPTTREL